MNISVTGAFVYFTIPIFGGIPITQTAVSSWIVTILLITACMKLGKNLQKRPTGVQVLVEKGVSLIYDLTISAMGAHNADWAPLMGTIFLCSVCGSLIGLTGFFRSATADLSCTLVWALMVSVIIWYNNIKNNGVVGWLKGFAEPIAVMTPMNVISEIAQPISMAFRHFGNIAGGGVINSIIYTAFSMLSTLVLGLIASRGWLVGAILMAVGAALWIAKKISQALRSLELSALCLGCSVFFRQWEFYPVFRSFLSVFRRYFPVTSIFSPDVYRHWYLRCYPWYTSPVLFRDRAMMWRRRNC